MKKLRYEAIPGLWIPALLYEPEKLSGKVPAVLNVNGHEANGSFDALHSDALHQSGKAWNPGVELRMVRDGPAPDRRTSITTESNQIDLTGTSGVALHYLAQRRAIDLLLAHPNADAQRLAVTGLSGGGLANDLHQFARQAREARQPGRWIFEFRHALSVSGARSWAIPSRRR